MLKAQLIAKMISANPGEKHDIAHFLKMYAYASAIGKLERVDERTQNVLELAAILHDISCHIAYKNTEIAMAKIRKSKANICSERFLKNSRLKTQYRRESSI